MITDHTPGKITEKNEVYPGNAIFAAMTMIPMTAATTITVMGLICTARRSSLS